MNMQTMGLGRKLLSLIKTVSDNLCLNLSDIETFQQLLARISPFKIFRGGNFRLKQVLGVDGRYYHFQRFL